MVRAIGAVVFGGVTLMLPAAPGARELAYGARGTALAGRSLVVPDGCALVTPGYIRCEDAELGWRHVERDIDPMAVIGPLKRELSTMGPVREHVVDCRPEEGDARCWMLAVERPASEGLFVMATSGAARGQRFFATCASVIPLRERLPPPCDQVLSAK